MASSKVVIVHSAQELTQLKSTSGAKLVVVYFTAAWCMPCQQIKPRVDQMSLTYPNVTFVKVDIDELSDVAQHAGVRAVPTFEFYKNNVRIASFAGAEVTRLEALVKQHKGSESSTDGGDASSTSSTTSGMSELNGFINKQQSSCLNESSKHPFSNVLTNSDSFLESDADEQLLLDIQFNQPIKLHSIKLIAKSAAHAPSLVKLFVNRINMGFEDAESSPPTQELTFSEGLTSGDGTIVELRFVKFQRVNNLVMFVKNNQGKEDTTRINHIRFFGQPIDSTDMKELKKTEAPSN